VHQADPRPAVSQLAVRAVDLAPGLEQAGDRGAFPGQQAVQRMPARGGVLEPPGVAPDGQ
jgi:hypothetical protein